MLRSIVAIRTTLSAFFAVDFVLATGPPSVTAPALDIDDAWLPAPRTRRRERLAPRGAIAAEDDAIVTRKCGAFSTSETNVENVPYRVRTILDAGGAECYRTIAAHFIAIVGLATQAAGELVHASRVFRFAAHSWK